MPETSPTVSIIIKTLNEERHIAAAIERARCVEVAMTAGFLADRSSDRTIEMRGAIHQETFS